LPSPPEAIGVVPGGRSFCFTPSENIAQVFQVLNQPTSYRSPWQNGHTERLIGSVRHECTDHLVAFNAEHLRRILVKYATYYNEMRTHVSLGKDAPYARLIDRIGDVVARPILGGLHHRYARL
jgi:hypothetical protein